MTDNASQKNPIKTPDHILLQQRRRSWRIAN